MAWTIRISKRVDKALAKLDKSVSSRILDTLEDISRLDDPRTRGKGLTSELSGLWRYRVGDYRVICDIEDDVLVVLVVDVAQHGESYGHRR